MSFFWPAAPIFPKRTVQSFPLTTTSQNFELPSSSNSNRRAPGPRQALIAPSTRQRAIIGTTICETAPGTPLADGQLVSVTGTLSGTQTLQVGSARLIESGATPPVSNDDLEASATGVVSAVLGSGRYLVGTVEVDASANAGATPVVGQRVEIEGTWAGNVLKVQSLQVRNVEELSEVELKGVVEQFRGVADFVVRGQRCNASQAAFGNGKPAQLKVGAKVKLHGRKQGDLLIVTELEFDD